MTRDIAIFVAGMFAAQALNSIVRAIGVRLIIAVANHKARQRSREIREAK